MLGYSSPVFAVKIFIHCYDLTGGMIPISRGGKLHSLKQKIPDRLRRYHFALLWTALQGGVTRSGYNPTMPLLSARCLGFPLFELDAQPLKLARRKTMALLAYLLVEAPGTFSRESLATLFWPEQGSSEAAASLRHALWEISQAVGEPTWLHKEPALLRVDAAGAGYDLDLREFDRQIAQGCASTDALPARIEALVKAVALYRGDFLTGFSLRDSPDFDQWQARQSEGCQAQAIVAFETLGALYAASGEGDLAVAAARHWLALDGLDERAHRALMGYYEALGQRAAALRQYDDCTRRLAQELGVEPEAATQALAKEIQSRKTPPSFVPQRAPALEPAQSEPKAQTAFVGREAELEKLARLLADPQVRLIMLLGPGGIGKTRLALQALTQLRQTSGRSPDFPDGAFWVPLAGVNSEHGLVRAVAQAVQLALRGSAGGDQEQLTRFLASRQCLLVLDNLEHLKGAETLLASLLSAAPGLKLMGTSRRRLNLAEGWVLEVSGLPQPGYHDRRPVNSFAAVQLFLASAARSAVQFSPDLEDWAAINRICQMVAGSPLGLELAAAWVKMYTCAEIAAEMERNLDFLSGQTAISNRPERLQSLRAAFEYSWRLLSEAEKSVFRRMAIFRAGFDREAAAQVSGAGLPLLSALMDHSLLRRLPGGRFELHEVLRQYAQEKLAAEPGEAILIADSHAVYYLDLLTRIAEQLKGHGQITALEVLRREDENIRAAWRHALQQRDLSRLLQAAPALFLYDEMGNQKRLAIELLTTTRETLARFKPLPIQVSDTLALRALVTAAFKRFCTGSSLGDRERRLHREALTLVEPLSEGREKAYAFLLLNIGPGILPPSEALAQVRQCNRMFQALGDEWGQALSWLIIADITNFGQYDALTSQPAYLASLEHFALLGNDWGRAVCLTGLGNLARRAGNLEEAGRLWAESISLFQNGQDKLREAETRNYWAGALMEAGKLAEAEQVYTTNLRLLEEFGEDQFAAYQRTCLAWIYVQQGNPEQARQHLYQAQATLHAVGDAGALHRLRVFASQLLPRASWED
jgi:DNA-binding SARP family transcriptional activator/predicted ATPase